MSYFNKKDKDKKISPILPKASGFRTTSSLGRSSMFSKPAGSFLSKLKKLSKKDIAMVLVGVSTLALAPVAEYYLSKPASENLLTPGFGDRGKAGSASIYEPGINSLSVGSPDGAGDVVTPLSVRDPLSLIRGASKPPSAAPLAPPPKYRDTLKNVAKNSFSRATKKAGAPVVIPRMQGGLRSMGSFAGAGGSRTSGKIAAGKMLADAKKASSKASSRTMAKPKGADFRGVASSPKGSSKDAMESLRARAGQSANHFSDGRATTGLDKAAKDAVELAGRGGSGQGSGNGYKGPSGSQSKNSHSRGGHKKSHEQEMAEKLAEAKQDFWKLYPYEVAKDISKMAIDNIVGKGIFEPLGANVAKLTTNYLEEKWDLGGSAPPEYTCLINCEPGEKCVNGFKEHPGVPPSKDRDVWKAWTQCDQKIKTSQWDEQNGVISGDGDKVVATMPIGEKLDAVTHETSGDGKTYLQNYDLYLGSMFKDAKDGSNAIRLKNIWKSFQPIILGFDDGQLPALELARSFEIRNKEFNELISDYKGVINQTENDKAVYRVVYDKALEDLGKIKDDVVSGKKVMLKGVSVEANSTEIKTRAEQLKTELAAYKKGFATVEQSIAFANNAVKIYEAQYTLINEKSGAIRDKFNEEVAVVRSNNPKEPGQGGTEESIKEAFKALTGFKHSIIGNIPLYGSTPNNNTGLLAMAGDYRDSGSEGTSSSLDKAFEWRGVDGNKKGEMVEIEETIKVEKDLWRRMSPAISLSKGLNEPSSTASGELEENFTSIILRLNQVEIDINDIKDAPTASLSPLQKMNEIVKAARLEFKERWNLNLDGTVITATS